MTEAFVDKVISVFGESGLIIQAKANEFYEGKSLAKNELVVNYDLCLNDKSPYLQKGISSKNYLACTLFFQCAYFPKAKNTFYNYIEGNLRSSDLVNKEQMYLIFNVIEFEHKYHVRPKNDLSFLINYLNKFVDINKNLQEFLLFKLYSAIILCEQQQFQDANKELLEIASYLSEAFENQNEKSLTNLFKFIEFSNNMLMLKNLKDDPLSSLGEVRDLAKSTYESLNDINADLALKVGFTLFEVFCKKGEIDNCLDICKAMKKTLKKQMFSGSKIKNGFFIYLALASRIAYCYLFKKDNAKLVKTIKSIEDANKFLNENDFQNKITKIAYDLSSTLYKYNAEHSLVKSDKIASAIKNFETMYSQMQTVGNKQEIFNLNEIYINIFVLNNSDNWAVLGNKCIDKIFEETKRTNQINTEDIPSLVFGVYNKISGLTESIITDPSATKQKEYKDKIQNYAKSLISITQNIFSQNPIFTSNYIKTAIIKAFYVYLSNLFKDGKYDEVRTELQNFEESDYGKEIIEQKNKEKLPCFGLLDKLNGDLKFKEKQYSEALNFYLEAKSHFENEETDFRATNSFCIALCYGLMKNKKQSKKFLSLSLSQYKGLMEKLKESNQLNIKEAEKYEEKIKLIAELQKN